MARRALEGLPGVKIFDDIMWLKTLRAWAIGIQVTAQARAPRLLGVTSWYVVVEEPYPWGKIHVFPAVEGGIVGTYPHQRNSREQDGLPYRTGGICLGSGLRSIGARSFDDEPFESEERLRWNVERAIEWVKAASADELVLPEEPFELPDFPVAEDHKIRVAFNETPETFAAWRDVSATWGTLTLVGSVERRIFHVLGFDSENGDRLISAPWGSLIEGMPRVRPGFWIKLNGVPVLDPWQAPFTWGELRIACGRLGLDLDRVLRRLAPRARDGAEHLVVLGFPIPLRHGKAPALIRWQGLFLPELARRPARGFRADERGLWTRDRAESFRSNAEIEWIKSENWSMEDLTSRGALPRVLREQRVLLLGAGALGCVVAELLVRGGVQDLVLIDDDELDAGNLVRHTLTALDVGKPKAPALADRLNAASPHARVRGFKALFPSLNANARALAQASTLVLDCTASDQVAHHDLEQFSWGGPRAFASLALGFDARRLLCFTACGDRFPSSRFAEATGPWLRLERQENAGRELSREGAGCWNPAFPARFDDIWALAGLGLKELARVVTREQPSPELVVFEGNEDGYGRAKMTP